MSLIQSQPLTISTYDPPSTPIALKAQDNQQSHESGRRLGNAVSGRKSELIENEYLENLKNTTQTPPVSKKGELLMQASRLTTSLAVGQRSRD
jgi:hypothetical protein